MCSRYTLVGAAAAVALLGALASGATAQPMQPSRASFSNPGDPQSYRSEDLVQSGHSFFGSASRGLALTVQEAVRRWGEPNGYILGQEAAGAILAGSVMAKASYLPGMPASARYSGRVRPSVSISAAKARAR